MEIKTKLRCPICNQVLKITYGMSCEFLCKITEVDCQCEDTPLVVRHDLGMYHHNPEASHGYEARKQWGERCNNHPAYAWVAELEEQLKEYRK